ncbi:MAG: LptF/LptG family permease [Sulfuricurvum sp.]|uniref:LptF/LptG family permease n=1 Tax=Sulfuricurvum sp. TaxID=2025608 RepID=UPI0025F07332|nr:LptF/LptG family permease [Sulfuricurvum sp.]MBV5320897.1 LptF/LptG family permease [Sulfuricurvum sp.]
MGKLRQYILSHLSILFFSIFLPLFAIASVIFLIKLATYTAVIQLNIIEMGKLYLFVIPELLFYTLPIAFVIGGALALYRLSNDNEMVVVFSLGISPAFIARVLAIPALLLTLLLLVNFIVVTPYIKIISANFLEKKRAEAKFNLTASEFGHHFGDWMLFVNKSDKNSRVFEDVVLFNKAMKDEILIKSDKAELINKSGVLQLKLDNGESYSYNNELLKTMLFKTAYINDKMSTDPMIYRDTLDYWTNDELRDRKNQRFITNSLLSLFPLISIFLIIALGVVHARHQKRWIYLWLFLSIIAFYASAMILQQWLGFHAIWVIALAWLLVTYTFYKRLVGNRF